MSLILFGWPHFAKLTQKFVDKVSEASSGLNSCFRTARFIFMKLTKFGEILVLVILKFIILQWINKQWCNIREWQKFWSLCKNRQSPILFLSINLPFTLGIALLLMAIAFLSHGFNINVKLLCLFYLLFHLSSCISPV